MRAGPNSRRGWQQREGRLTGFATGCNPSARGYKRHWPYSVSATSGTGTAKPRTTTRGLLRLFTIIIIQTVVAVRLPLPALEVVRRREALVQGLAEPPGPGLGAALVGLPHARYVHGVEVAEPA